jgi:hypothetical protein
VGESHYLTMQMRLVHIAGDGRNLSDRDSGIEQADGVLEPSEHQIPLGTHAKRCARVTPDRAARTPDVGCETADVDARADAFQLLDHLDRPRRSCRRQQRAKRLSHQDSTFLAVGLSQAIGEDIGRSPEQTVSWHDRAL